MTITITFLNDSGNKPIVYMDRADLDRFTLKLETDSVAPIAISEVTIKFPLKIIKPENVATITVASDGWDSPRAARSNLMLKAKSAINLSSAAPLTIKLAGVKSGFVAATNDELLVHAGGEAPTTKIFLMRYPTEAGDLTKALTPKLLPGRVFRTPERHSTIENVISLVLTNNSPSTPLVQGKWVTTPTILVSFVYGNDIGSLAPARPLSDPNSAFNIVIDPQATYKDDKKTFEWSAAPPDKGSADDVSPTWSLQPVPENVSVLGPQSGASVEFRISMLSTAAPAGITLIYLQYSGFPGYSDGYFTLQLQKREPRPTIAYFDGDPTQVAALNDKVTVKWQTIMVDKVELQFGDTTLSSTTGQINIERGTYSQAIDRTTMFTLNAYDDVADLTPQHKLQWTAQVPAARILTFTADKTRQDAGKPVTLNWSTAYARKAEIRSSIDPTFFIPADQQAKGSKVYYPSRAVTYTLHLDGQGDPDDQRVSVFVLQQKLGVPAHAPEPQRDAASRDVRARQRPHPPRRTVEPRDFRIAGRGDLEPGRRCTMCGTQRRRGVRARRQTMAHGRLDFRPAVERRVVLHRWPHVDTGDRSGAVVETGRVRVRELQGQALDHGRARPESPAAQRYLEFRRRHHLDQGSRHARVVSALGPHARG